MSCNQKGSPVCHLYDSALAQTMIGADLVRDLSCSFGWPQCLALVHGCCKRLSSFHFNRASMGFWESLPLGSHSIFFCTESLVSCMSLCVYYCLCGSPCIFVQGRCLEGKDLAIPVLVPLMTSAHVFPQDGFELSLRARRGPESISPTSFYRR